MVNEGPDFPFFEALANPVIYPLSLGSVTLQALQFIDGLRNTDIRFFTDHQGYKYRGETKLHIRAEREHYNDAHWKNVNIAHDKNVGDYFDIEELRRDGVGYHFDRNVEPAPHFRIDIDINKKPRGGDVGDHWSTVTLLQTLLHEIHIHGMEFARMIHTFWNADNPLDGLVEQLNDEAVQHQHFLGNPEDNDPLHQYKIARTRVFLACTEWNRHNEWEDFKTIEIADLNNYGGNNWRGENNGDPTEEFLNLVAPL